MADKKIKIEVDLDAEPSIAQLKKLKLALKETTAGSEDWNKYKNAINDTEDALNSAGKGADNFAEIIGTLPGPLGELGNKLGSTVNTLKIFGGIKLDALKNSFTELGKDIGQAASSILKITGIQKLYTITTIAMSKALRFVGIEATAASFGVKAFSAALVATGIGAIVVGLGLLISAFMNAGDEADVTANKVAKLNKEFDKLRTDAKLNANETIARLNAEGATQETIAAAKKKIIQDELNLARNAFDQYQTQMTAAEIMDEKASEGYKKALEGRKQAEKDIKQLKSDLRIADYNEQERLRKESEKEIKPAKEDPAVKAKEEALKLIAKNEKDAALSLLDVREQEKRKIVNDYNEKIKLATDNGTETFILEEAKLKALSELNDKFRKEDNEKEKQTNKEKFDEQKAILDYKRAGDLIDEDEYRKQLEELAIKYADSEIERLAAQTEYLTYVNSEKDKALEKDKERADEQKKINIEIAQSWIDLGNNIAGTFQQLAGLFEQGSDMAKTFGIISVLINAATAIGKINLDFSEAISSKKKTISIATDAIAQGTAMFPLNPIVGGALIGAGTASLTAASAGLAVLRVNKGLQIAAVGITSGAQIAAILSAKKSANAATGGGGGDAGGAEAPLPAYNSGMAMNTPQINTTGGANPATQISQTIQNAQSVPIKAYVTSGDITSQQQLDRKANRGATFNLG